jgi:DUF4097 and DUF4098 domain-containing protein YvlB
MKYILFFCLYLFLAGGAFAQNNLSVIEEETLPVTIGGKLEIETEAGSIDIKTAPGNSASVKISGNDNVRENMGFNILNGSKGIKITGGMKDKNRNMNGNFSLKFEVTVPESYDVDVSTGGGSVHISGIKGKVDINTAGGEIKINDVLGNINAKTMGGSMELAGCKGDVAISTMGGGIEVKDFKGSLDATTMGGSIELTGSDGPVKAMTYGGSISLAYTGSNEGIELSTMAGNIEVVLPESFNANADLSTAIGDIQLFSKKSAKWESSIKTTLNSGGKELKCSTMAGNIIIKSN